MHKPPWWAFSIALLLTVQVGGTQPIRLASLWPDGSRQSSPRAISQVDGSMPGMPKGRFDPDRLAEPSHEWAVVVGASTYKHLPSDDWLPGCKKDALALAQFLKSPRGGSFPAEHVQLLVDEQATVAAVRLALEQVVRQHQNGDVVYVFFACHGKVESFGAAEVAYLMMYDSDDKHLNATALPMEELRRTLDLHMRGAHVVLITDACHSGSIFGSAGEKNRRTLTALSDYLLEVGERKGSLHLVACRRDESSIEDPRLDGHGILTYCLLQALNGMAVSPDAKMVRTQDLVEFITRQVPKISYSQQHPRHSNGYIDEFPLARLDLPGPVLDLAPFPGDVLSAGVGVVAATSVRGAATLTVRGGEANSELYLVRGTLQRTVGRVLTTGNSLILEGLEPGEYTLVESANSGQRQWKVKLRSGLQTFDTRLGVVEE